MAKTSNKKPPQYPRNEASFIQVTDDAELTTVKEGSIWTYWKGTSERDVSYGNDKYMFISEKVRRDLHLVMLRDSYKLSTKEDFPPYTPKKQRDQEAKDIDELVRQKQRTEQAETASSNPPKSAPSGTSQQPKQQKSTFSGGTSTGKAGKGASFVKRDARPTWADEVATERSQMSKYWGDLSTKQFELLFKLAYKNLTGKDTGVTKVWGSKTQEERQEYVWKFIEFELLVKGRVADELIPPLEILKKIPIIANDEALMYYYEKKLGNKKPDEEEGRFVKFTKGLGLKFDKKALPVSFRAAMGIGKLAVGGGKLLSGAIGSLLGAKKEPTAKDDKSFGKYDPKKENQPTAKGGLAGMLSGVGSNIKETFTPSKENQEINKAAFKMIGEGLKSIASLLKDRLPGKKEAEDKSNVKAQNVEGTDKDIAEPIKAATTEKSSEKKDGEPKAASGGIFSKILGSLLAPLLELAAMFTTLKLAMKPLLSLLGLGGKVAEKVAVETAEKTAIKATEKVAVETAEKTAIKATEKVAVETAEKTAIKATEKAGAKMAGKAIAKAGLKATLLSVPALAWLPALGFAGYEASKGNWTGAGMELGAGALGTVSGVGGFAGSLAASVQSADFDRQQEEAESAKLEAASSRNTSSAVQAAATAKEEMKEQKQTASTKQIIDATSRNTNNIVQQQPAGGRMFPRTQSSTFQKFIDSRAVFA